MSDISVPREDWHRQDKVPFPSAHVERDGALRVRLLGRRDEDDLCKGYYRLLMPSFYSLFICIVFNSADYIVLKYYKLAEQQPVGR